MPRSEIAERSSCNDFALSFVHVRSASALDQLGCFRIPFPPQNEKTRYGVCLTVQFAAGFADRALALELVS